MTDSVPDSILGTGNMANEKKKHPQKTVDQLVAIVGLSGVDGK